MRVLLFGKSGQIATEIRRQANVVALGRDQIDLRNPALCRDAILKSNAQVVINAAAYTDVDGAESNEELANIINGDSPIALAHAAAKIGIPFLHLSSDYVFNGSGTRPWSTYDDTSPINAYGRSKVRGEVGISTSNCNFAILRTSWVFSPFGNNFVDTMLKLSKSHEQLDVVTDQIGGPTSASAVARSLLIMAEAMLQGKSGGIFHFSGAPDVSWAEFAREVFHNAQKEVRVNEIMSKNYPFVAKRPLNSRLECGAIRRKFGICRPDWKADLRAMLCSMESIKS